MAQKIRSNVKCTYIMIDLPEANVLASYYLSKCFPDLRILLADEIQDKRIEKEQIDKYDFIIIPPWYDIQGIAIDLFINTRSMMEMNVEAIQKYFNFIQRTIADNGYFLNINRYYKDTVGYPIKLSEYPYDEHWNVILSNPSWKQQHIHQLLTQRTVGQGDIKEELVKIEQLYQENKRLGRDVKKIDISKKILISLIGLPLKIAKLVLPARLYKTFTDIVSSQL